MLCDAFRGGVLTAPLLSEVSSIPSGKISTSYVTIFKRCYYNLLNSAEIAAQQNADNKMKIENFELVICTAMATLTLQEYDHILTRRNPEFGQGYSNGDDDIVGMINEEDDGGAKFEDPRYLRGEVENECAKFIFAQMRVAAFAGFILSVNEYIANFRSKFEWLVRIDAMAEQCLQLAERGERDVMTKLFTLAFLDPMKEGDEGTRL